MAGQTHNGTVMTTNLSTLPEKCLKGGHRCEGVCAPAHVQWRRCAGLRCVRACVRAASRLKGQRALRERAGARGWDRRWLPIKLPQPHPELLHLRQRVTITDWALRLGRPPPVNQEGACKAGEGQPCQRFAGNFLQLQKKLQRNKTKQKKNTGSTLRFKGPVVTTARRVTTFTGNTPALPAGLRGK